MTKRVSERLAYGRGIAVGLVVDIGFRNRNQRVTSNDGKSKAMTGRGKDGRAPVGKPTRGDRRVLTAWNSDAYRSFVDCDLALGLEEGTTKRIIDANRQREKQSQPKPK